MRTHPDRHDDFILHDDEYVARISKKLADQATKRFRQGNRGPGHDHEFYENDYDEEYEYFYGEDGRAY